MLFQRRWRYCLRTAAGFIFFILFFPPGLCSCTVDNLGSIEQHSSPETNSIIGYKGFVKWLYAGSKCNTLYGEEKLVMTVIVIELAELTTEQNGVFFLLGMGAGVWGMQ